MCVCVCVPYLLRGPLTDLRETWWVDVGWPPICPWGVLFRKGQRVDGSLSLSTTLYMRQPHATHCDGAFCFAVGKQQSLILRLLLHVLHLNNVCRCTLQLPLRGSFSKRSTGRWVNGSTGQTGQQVDESAGQMGQQVTFTILYMIADDARLTPPRCKKAHGVWWHQARATPLQKAHSVFCSLDG